MKDKDILISIIVPIYNVEKYINKCIESILNQTIKNIEIILVDDGSTDKCGVVCDKYAELDKRIKVIHKKNGGLSSARNSGLDIAKGDYIGFVDSDDWIDCNMYKELLHLAYKNNADVVQCEFIKTYTEINIINAVKEKVICFTNIEGLNNLYNERYVPTVVVWNKLYKSELFNNIKFPLGKLHEDEFTTYKLLYKSIIICNTNKIYYYYRQIESSIMHNKYSRRRLVILQAYDERTEFAQMINNNELYSNTLKGYFFTLIYVYFSLLQDMPEDYKAIKLVKSKIGIIYWKYMKSRYKTTKVAILFTIFKISPVMYRYIQSKRNYKRAVAQ